ncbi:MAG: hypothetical protein CR971_00170 [candidate division SR1 bacterium]|nr:MAG: hypothetical protein CR971_00170 [candidate division SR1 bacterium]
MAENTKKLLITCPFGLSSVLGSELKRLKLQPYNSFERGTYVDTDISGLYKINIWSRVANKVYLSLAEKKVENFDQLYDVVATVDWGKHIHTSDDISVQVVTKNSKLHSMRTIQSVAHKAVISSLQTSPYQTDLPLIPSSKEGPKRKASPCRGGVRRTEGSCTEGGSGGFLKTAIYIHLENDYCQVFINTSGASLHERGWRTATGEAPLKENLAAGLVLLSGWRFKHALLDPFCGSGTLLIEAAMIARNIAPGLQRRFAFESFSDFDAELFAQIRKEAVKQQFDGKYMIIGCDSNPHMEEIILENARNAGVEDTIHFACEDFLRMDLADYKKNFCESGNENGNSETENICIVTNPPYGKRIQSESLALLYQKLADILAQNGVSGGVISSYFDFEQNLDMKKWSKKRVYNGADECAFWWKKM